MKNKPVAYVALLRGINVGGNGKVSMVALKHCFEQMGFTSVKTYINSGNVIFVDSGSNAKTLAVSIEKALSKTFKFPIAVVVKNLPQMRKIVAAFPGAWSTDTTLRRYVMFLRPSIDGPAIIKQLTPNPDADEVLYCPGAILWSAKLASLGHSDMQKLISKPIYKEMTIRNSNTTLKVYALMQEAAV